MKAVIRRSGGIGGFIQQTQIDTSEMEEQERQTVDDALATNRLAAAAAPSRDHLAADTYSYEVTTPDGTFLIESAVDHELTSLLNELIDLPPGTKKLPQDSPDRRDGPR